MTGGSTVPHLNQVDDRIVFPHPDSDYYNQDPYRCPVSTPANSRRPIKGQATNYVGQSVPNEHMYVAFSNRCEKKQKPFANEKQYRRKANTNAQSYQDTNSTGKHYYFIARIQPAALHTVNSHRAPWLNTLCSQPVEEIFTKYKRRLEASMVREAWQTRDVSTPGEKALVSAWSCNSSQRSQSCTPSLRTPTPVYSSTTPTSRMSVYSPVKALGYESDSEIRKREPELSLVPVVSSKTLLHKVNTSPRSSVSSVKSHIINIDNKRRIKSSNDIYDKFKREPRRQKKLLPRRGNVYKLAEEEPNKTDTSLQETENDKLEQSTFEVVSFGASSKEVTDKKAASIGGKHPANQCRYCMRDKDEKQLPDITAKG